MTKTARPWFPIGVLALIAAALAIGWTGFIASDDSLYYTGAIHWLDAPPFAGDNHWSTRFPLMLTFAGVLATMGRGMAAFGVTALLWYTAFVAIVALFARRMAGARAGWIAALLVGTMPMVAVAGSIVGIDLTEAVALIAGAWLLGEAAPGRAGLRQGVLAGLCFGLAILSRETAVLSLAGLTIVVLWGRPVRREVLIAASIGIALVLGAEALFQGIMTGHPLRRYDIAFHHDEHIDRAANLEGNFLLHPAIDPLLVLLINDDFGLLFWALIAAGALAGRRLSKLAPSALVVLSAMAVTDFLLVAVLAHKLVLNPRYFTLPAVAAVLWVVLSLEHLSPRWRWAIVAALVAVNFGFLSLINRHPRWDVEALVIAAAQHPQDVIVADPVTVRRAAIPLNFAKLRNAAPGPATGLHLVEEGKAPASWPIVDRYPSPPTVAGGVLRAIGLEAIVPGALRHRLFSPSPTMLLVRPPLASPPDRA
ncbi:ArnT family glycosyltransferase [Sphingomonas sp. GlSt437]